jgi:hypothetical protein
MSVWFENQQVLAGPATHALVVGVSRYTHLPEGDDPAPQDRETFGLGQLDCAATGAFRFARWLAEEHRNPAAPCGSVRLLLSPSPLEQQCVPMPDVLPATREHVETALGEWWRACNERPDNVAVLYAAGHGIMISKDDGMIVLLEDFAHLHKNVLGHALDVPSIRRGMAGPQMARRQFYFVDACQVRPRFVRDTKPRGGVGFDEPAEPAPDVSAMFVSAAPGTLALGVAGEGTLFSSALVDCLRRHALTPDDTGCYSVSATSLVGPLGDRVNELARAHERVQTVTAGGVLKPVPFHVLKEPPLVTLTIEVDPATASELAYASVTYDEGAFALDSERLHPPPFSRELPAGLYALSVKIEPPSPPYCDQPSRPFELRPWQPKLLQVRLV